MLIHDMPSATVLEGNNEITHSKVSSTKSFNYQENGYTYFVYYKNVQKSFNQLKALKMCSTSFELQLLKDKYVWLLSLCRDPE